MDALFLKLRVDGRVKNVAAYLMVGIDLEGRKECLGIWLGQSEFAKYWLGVLNECKNRGVNDVLIFAVDGLTGFPEAIRAVLSPGRDPTLPCPPGQEFAGPDVLEGGLSGAEALPQNFPKGELGLLSERKYRYFS